MDDPRDGTGAGGAPLTVASYWSDAEAGMAKSLLEAHGIPATLSSEVPHSVLPVNVDGMGEVRVQVPAGMAEEARQVLKEIFEGSPTDDETPDRDASE